MNLENISLKNEVASDFDAVEQLSADAFGPGRFSRSAFRLREGVPHEDALSFVARDQAAAIVGSVRLTRILIGERPAILLGPLVITPDYKSKGLGAILMERAKEAAQMAGHELIILVGDLPYYQRFGFTQVPFGKITLPAPVEKHRLLQCELQEGAAANFSGETMRWPNSEAS